MTRLSLSTLTRLNPAVRRPAYDPAAAKIGVVHLGPGAFHRAHQAPVFDDLLATDSRWGVCAVSLRHADLADALGPQDGLYLLAELGEETRWRVIGSLRETLVAPDPVIFKRFASPDTRLVTLTVTEKGYCLGPDGRLDLDHPDARQDLATPNAPHSAIGWIVEGLRRRRAAGVPPFVTLSCDNLADNGGKLRDAVIALAQARGGDLADWIAGEAAFPSSMVDSITPATDDALRAAAAEAAGLTDAWPVQREVFTQWVVEDHPALAPLAAAGVTLTLDVHGYEAAKLKLLNGPHSTLAYVGLLHGYETVAQAMTDAPLAAFLERLMRETIAPHVAAPRGFDVQAYIGDVLARFRNPAIAHRLSQIAWDGSQKLQQRLIPTVQAAIAAGHALDRLAVPLAAWMRFVRFRATEGGDLTDPMAETLLDLGRAARGVSSDVDGFLALPLFPPDLAAHAGLRAAIAAAYLWLPRLPD